ncbi:MAG TPA: family 78 glycoside hydrolase catalytic domain, partial [Acidimicrobiales bacterium]|nr:family 78 glycoside hydrolase catalytic domain [Acidimicrobiales bacterium]
MKTEPLLPVDLRCAHRAQPLGVELDRVSFGWRLTGDGAGRRQTGYQVCVWAQDALSGGDAELCWDSGLVEQSTSAHVDYGGTPLLPTTRYDWRVRARDESGQLGPWSAVATFETALDPAVGWSASWIGVDRYQSSFDPPAGDGPADTVALAMAAPPCLRRAFVLAAEVFSARLYVTALGVYEVALNGHQITEDVLSPGWTDYGRRVLYRVYDVTTFVTSGENVIAAIVADGWAGSFYGFDSKRRGAHYSRQPQFLAQLVVTFKDGSTVTVATDEHWRASTGCTRRADLLMGEDRDASLEPPGWKAPGFDDSAWEPVQCRPRDGALVLADPGPPVRVLEELPATGVTRAPNGPFIVDFGQNVAGWVRLSIDEPAPVTVTVRHGEMLAEDGSLYIANLRTARQTDSYRVAGGPQVLEPRFTFHGFRYAEVGGLESLRPSDVRACVVHSDTPRTGTFECSSPALNQLYSNIDWSQRANFISVPTDCPQRDERLGWLGDAQVFVRTAAYNRDVASFFTKWLDDVVDAQLPSGAFADFAPRISPGWAGAPAWGDAGIIVPWTIYQMYGDSGVLVRNYNAMKAWMEFVERGNPSRLRARGLGNNYGDWLAPEGDLTNRELLATAYWAYDATLMTEIAQVVGHPEDARSFAGLAAELRAAFAGAYVGHDGKVESGTQTAYALALHMGLVPAAVIPQAAANLVAAIAKADWHITTGFVGVSYLLPVLSSNGYSDVAYRLVEQRSFPSWLYTIDQGATTIWERWDGWTREHGFQSPRMNSFNHYSLGSVGEWLYRFVLGIDLAPGSVAFERIVIRPHPAGSLRFARGSFQSVQGRIATTWARRHGVLTLTSRSGPTCRQACTCPRPGRAKSKAVTARDQFRLPSSLAPLGPGKRCSKSVP